MPDDHSELVPPLPIPNRTVKRLHADDSADSRVKVGNRQAPFCTKPPVSQALPGVCAFWPPSDTQLDTVYTYSENAHHSLLGGDVR